MSLYFMGHPYELLLRYNMTHLNLPCLPGGRGRAGPAGRSGGETLPGQHPDLLTVLLSAARVRQHGEHSLFGVVPSVWKGQERLLTFSSFLSVKFWTDA